MEIATHHSLRAPTNPARLAALERNASSASRGVQSFAANDPRYPPLDEVTRPTVPTDQAAYYLNRRPQTLREWAMSGKVIQAQRVNGRLAWPVAEIKRVLGVV